MLYTLYCFRFGGFTDHSFQFPGLFLWCKEKLARNCTALMCLTKLDEARHSLRLFPSTVRLQLPITT